MVGLVFSVTPEYASAVEDPGAVRVTYYPGLNSHAHCGGECHTFTSSGGIFTFAEPFEPGMYTLRAEGVKVSTRPTRALLSATLCYTVPHFAALCHSKSVLPSTNGMAAQ